jgi:hypothetical protein
MLKNVSYKNKFSLTFFIMAKLISLPTAFSIVNGDLDKAFILLSVYSFLIFITIVLSIIPDKKKEIKIPDGEFYSDGMVLKIVNGKIQDFKNL